VESQSGRLFYSQAGSLCYIIEENACAVSAGISILDCRFWIGESAKSGKDVRGKFGHVWQVGHFGQIGRKNV
jgi:hypothetical protein